MKRLIDDFKFNGARSSSRDLARLMNMIVPYFPGEVVLTYIPTARSHVRQRGYDHAYLLAKDLAYMRKLKVRKLLKRSRTARQVGADRRTRLEQARDLYLCSEKLDKNATYILIDDIMTTGATLHYGAKALRDSGAKKIAVITAAHPPRS